MARNCVGSSFCLIANSNSIYNPNKPIYAIYSICISISIFLSYADFGFIKSAVKYGGEYFSKNDLISEIKLYGFTSFLLFISIIIIASSIFYLSLIQN